MVYNKFVCSSVPLFHKGNIGYVIIISVYLSSLANFDFDKSGLDITPCAMSNILQLIIT